MPTTDNRETGIGLDGKLNHSEHGKNFPKDKRKGMLMNSVAGTDAQFNCPELVVECKQRQGHSCDHEQCIKATERQCFQEVDLRKNVCDHTKSESLNNRSDVGFSDQLFCDNSSSSRSSFCKITPSDIELESFLRKSLGEENLQISCCGAYGDLTRFMTVIRHPALYQELFIQGPSFRELINTEALLRFNVLYGALRQLYAGVTPWDEDAERHVRRRLKNHLRLMVLLHLSTLLPLDTLELVRNTLAGPMENPAAPFAGVMGWGMVPPPANMLEGGAVAGDQNLGEAVLANQVNGGVQLPVQEHLNAAEAEVQPQQDNGLLVDEDLLQQHLPAAPAHIGEMNNNPIIANNDLNDVDNNNVNNLNEVNNNNNNNNNITSAASLTGLSAELLSFYLTTASHVNLRDRTRTDEMCDLLQQSLPHLSSRQTFLVVTVLELQQRGWTEVKAPDRSG